MHEYASLLRRNPAYRNLWLARVVSNLGDWFNLLASAALITSLTGAGTAVSYLFLARMLPVFVMSPFAGVLADRYERRMIMVATDVLRAITVLCFLLVRTSGDIWLLYVLTVVQFILSSLYTPAHSALLSNIVEPRDLVTANALDGFTWSTMLALGALLGGVAAALFGVTTAFLIDAATFLVSGWFVLRIGAVPRPAHELGRSAGFFDFVDGLAYLRQRPFILGLSLVKAGGSLVWGAINVMEIPLATQVFPLNGNGALTLAILYTMTGIGTGIGPLLVRRWVGDGQTELMWAITASFLVMTCGVLGLGFAPSLGWVVMATLVRSLGSGSLWVFSSAILQRTVADAFRGRVFAFEFAALTLTQSLSIIWAGLALDQWGLAVQEGFIAAAMLSLVVSVVWAWFQLRQTARVAPVS
jgi:MFS family permease